ncbi:probable arginine--tRNA ligase, mitochondrial isoform X1 [Microplitis demolitor]|uniref:probable arginine--tRNA ligase, mitochondrial isoform X1 n=2 Tax=Microplitis demolitor TaxID=69319 RepID=UPI0004CCE33D|nr:probable arginine--tRNA ligase, mitochondrial isoform X1 [Microplitis demolitor]
MMSYQIRCFIKKEICKYADIPEKIFMSHMCLERNTKNGFSFELPLKTNSYTIEKHVKNIIQQKFDGALKNIRIKKKDNHDLLSIDVDKHFFIKEILQTNLSQISVPSVSCNREKVVVEFSSPNIAKPFHIGHLRSTIIGNFAANINEFFNNSVVKLNYLGDWGTQIGLVILGMNLMGMPNKSIKNNSIGDLYEAYVYANKLAETDHEILDQARKIFQQLENGDGMYFSQWQSLKKSTINELDDTYKRIGIKFDEYNWESSYNSSNIHHILKLMGDFGILTRDSQGRKVVPLDNRLVPIVKSDGSTLYLARDIAAAIDRAEKYNFDKMYYVADSSQRDHFITLKSILTKLNMAWASKIHHLQFGKIIGMSTRKGTVVFLNNFLDEVNEIIKQKQHQLSTTKVDKNEDHQSTDILGMSAIIINDLKQRRLRDYAFNWDTALDMKGETGIKLQYTHCRLVNLKENCGATVANQCDPTLLEESIIDELIMSIAQFDEAVVASYQTLEACYLVKYLFNLSHVVNRTLERLRVKGEPMDIASQRLLLFQVAKNVLNTGMKLLGLMPLNKM